MSTIRSRLSQQDGGVLVLVAIVLPVLLVLSGGGIVTFSVTASHRELQRAADQAALAGAATLPPFDPKVLTDAVSFPMDFTQLYDDLLASLDGAGTPDEIVSILDTYVPRMGDLIVDPRQIACLVASEGNLSEHAARMIGAFGSEAGDPDTVCDDIRVRPALASSQGMTPVDCANALVTQVAEGLPPISQLTGEYLGPIPVVDWLTGRLIDPLTGRLLGSNDSILGRIQVDVNNVVNMPLNHVLPALLSPRMQVDTYSKLYPPMLDLLHTYDRDTGELVYGDSDGRGMTIQARAVAQRRIKNAIVVPIFPTQRLLIETRLPNPLTGRPYTAIDFMVGANLNTALAAHQPTLIDAVDNVDQRLNSLMSTLGLPCSGLLYNLRQDLRDIYSPPTGPAPSAYQIVDAAVDAAQSAAARTGIPQPDPTNPQSLAGEAFLLVGVTVDSAMRPISALQKPILDVAIVSMSKVAEGDYRAAVISAANAHGLFRASLVE